MQPGGVHYVSQTAKSVIDPYSHSLFIVLDKIIIQYQQYARIHKTVH